MLQCTLGSLLSPDGVGLLPWYAHVTGPSQTLHCFQVIRNKHFPLLESWQSHQTRVVLYRNTESKLRGCTGLKIATTFR